MLFNNTKLPQTRKERLGLLPRLAKMGETTKTDEQYLESSLNVFCEKRRIVQTCHDKAAQPGTTPVISLNDKRLLAKLISCDVIAQVLLYHAAS